MKNKHIKKFLYIVCSLFLVFSMCVPNFNLNVSADEPQNTQTQEISETENNSDVPATETNTPESNKEVPDQISVQTLEQTQSDDSTDRVEYVDEKGKIIEGAPTTIKLGKISDHTEITIPDKKYEFKNAKVSDEDCVFIGQYENYIYYSTDGNIAKKLKDKQLLVMTYSESKNSVNEEIEQVTTEDTNKSEESTEQNIDNEGETEQSEELNVPESISVQSLDEALQISVANGDENATSTDRVEYVDVNGKPIVGAPSVIGVGAIADHKELAIEGRHFEFKSAKVDGKNCVYIGKYNDTIYYSTDGVIAIKMEDGQKVTMTYQEYYFVTIKEVLPTNCDPGTICTKKGSEDVPVKTGEEIRVNAGEDWVVSVTPGVPNNKKRYKITSVTSQNGANIIKAAGDDYGATYAIRFQKDDIITIAYDAEGVYRVMINTVDNNGIEYINIEHSKENGWDYIPEQHKLVWTYTEDNVDPVDGSIKLPVFHTKKNYRLIHMVLNKQTVSAADSPREVPSGTGTNDAVKGHAGELIVNASMEDVPRAEREECQYEYSIKVQRQSGGWQDLNFDLAPYAINEQALTVRMITNGRRSDEGLDVVMWDPVNKKLIPIHDNDTVNMDAIGSDTLLTQQTRQVRIFFAKPKSGYSFTNGGVNVGQPHSEDSPTSDGAISIAQYGSISEMNANTMDKPRPFEIYQKTWSDAKRAAQSEGYTMYLSYGGAKAKKPLWLLYAAYFSVASDSIYVHYNSGAGEGVLPADAVVKNIPYNEELDTRTNKPMQSYGENPNTYEGKRGMGSTFRIGEEWPEPTCEGYEFLGWKLRLTPFYGTPQYSDKLYQHNEVFNISEENYDFAANRDLPVSLWDDVGYQFVAQWKKIDTKKVEVKHYLKIPDGKVRLEKTTSGTISFATGDKSVKAFAKPEKNGTFPGYVFDTEDSRNELEKEVKNDSSSDTITLNLYYKPTVLKVSKTVTGYNLEPNRLYMFTIKAVPPSGTDASTATITAGKIFIKKGTDDKVKTLTFTNNQATFNLAKDESVDISCLPTGWTYTVMETDPGKNFKTSYKLNGSEAKDGRAAEFKTSTTGNDEVMFTNASTVAPPETGRTIHDSEWILLLIVVLIISAGGMTFLRKMKKRY